MQELEPSVTEEAEVDGPLPEASGDKVPGAEKTVLEKPEVDGPMKGAAGFNG